MRGEETPEHSSRVTAGEVPADAARELEHAANNLEHGLAQGR